jgi:hypothetical protein
VIEKTFTNGLLQEAAHYANEGDPITHVWQLVPDIFSFDLQDEFTSVDNFFEYVALLSCMNEKFIEPTNVIQVPWQHLGYWHIARTQVHSKSYGYSEYYYNDMAQNLRLGHIESTFQPDFCKFTKDDQLIEISGGSMKKKLANVQSQIEYDGNEAKKYKNIQLMLNAGKKLEDRRKRRAEADKHSTAGFGRGSLSTGTVSSVLQLPKAPQLSSTLQSHPEQEQAYPNKRRHLDSLRSPVDPSLLARLSQPAAPSPSLPLPESSQAEPSAFSKDIGVFDDPGPVPSRVRFEEEQAPSSVEVPVPSFTVPKPSLKSKKPAKGKGVVSSVLGADGSIRQEQSRML